MKKTAFTSLLLVGLSSFALSNVNFYETGSINLSSTFNYSGTNGTNPFAMAYDGSSLYVAGYNNSASSSSTAIVKITDPWSAPTVTQWSSSVVSSTPANLGYESLTYDASTNRIYSTFDAGASSANGLQAFDAATGTSLFNYAERGSSGVAIDPGYLGGGSAAGGGVGFLQFSAGRRQELDANGNVVYGASGSAHPGFVFYFSGQDTYYRSLAFDPNGDIFVRGGNNVYTATRSGANSATGAKYLFNNGSVTGEKNMQNLAYMSMGGTGMIMYNDRYNNNATFDAATHLINSSTGAAEGLSFFNGSGSSAFDINTSGGLFDYKWDAATNQLVVLDYNNSQAYIFGTQAVPSPAGIIALGLGIVGLLVRKRSQ